MKKIYLFLCLVLFVTSSSAQMSGKRPTKFGFDINVKPPIYYDLYITLNPQDAQQILHFNIHIQNDLLFFIKTDDGYYGGYDLIMFIQDSVSGRTVFSELWKEKFHETQFEITNSNEKYQLSHKTFQISLPPDKYNVKLKLTDQNSGNTFSSHRHINIPDASAERISSEIKLLFQENNLSAEILIGDQNPVVEYNQDLKTHVQFSFSNAEQLEVYSLLYLISGDTEKEIRRRQYELAPQDSVYTFEEILNKEVLKEEGKYLLRYQIKAGDDQLSVHKNFSVIWYQKPVYLYDVELAIQPMSYILSKEEQARIEALSENELREWFDTYWKAKDPKPSTLLNEIQIEFYNRVMKADRQYADRYHQGWQSDRGKTLILYGDPDRIETQRYTIDTKPYEIWFYEQMGKKLIFVDVNEDKSYRLMGIEEIGENSNE